MASEKTPETKEPFSVERMDLRQTARVLGAMTGYLEAEATVRAAHGMKEDGPLLKQVRAEYDRITRLVEDSEPGNREEFFAEHQPRYDVLDGVYDCASEACPRVGYESPEARKEHHRMWGFDNPLIDIRQTQSQTE